MPSNLKIYKWLFEEVESTNEMESYSDDQNYPTSSFIINQESKEWEHDIKKDINPRNVSIR